MRWMAGCVLLMADCVLLMADCVLLCSRKVGPPAALSDFDGPRRGEKPASRPCGRAARGAAASDEPADDDDDACGIECDGRRHRIFTWRADDEQRNEGNGHNGQREARRGSIRRGGRRGRPLRPWERRSAWRDEGRTDRRSAAATGRKGVANRFCGRWAHPYQLPRRAALHTRGVDRPATTLAPPHAACGGEAAYRPPCRPAGAAGRSWMRCAARALWLGMGHSVRAECERVRDRGAGLLGRRGVARGS